MTGAKLSGTLAAVADEVIRSRDALNELDAAAGDGDLGVTLAAAAKALKESLDEAPDGVAPLLHSCGLAIAKAAPSTCGTLVATGFLTAAKAADATAATPVELLARLSEAAVQGIEARGKAAPGDRTLLDALAPVADAFKAAAAEGLPLVEALSRGAAAAKDGAVRTAEMEPRAGRARWVGERSRGHEDAGAAFVALAFEAVRKAVADGERVTGPRRGSGSSR